MFHLHIDPMERWDSVKEEFVYVGPREGLDLKLEHSLLSLSIWESKYHKSYLNSDKTASESLDYFSMMVVGQDVPPEVFYALTDEQIKDIKAYIDDPMTATTFAEDKGKKKPKKKIGDEIITAELLYYYMTVSNIPFECEKWHLNKLITLIRVCGIMNDPDRNKKKKLTSADIQARRLEMEARRAKYNTNG